MTSWKTGLLGLLIAGLVAACATTKVTNVWYEKGHPPVRKVLVLGVSENDRDRRLFEDALVQALRKDGVDAEAAHRVIPANTKPTKQLLIEAVRKHGYDAVMITRVVGVDEKSYYYPPSNTYTYLPPPAYRDMWSYYPRVYDSYSTTPGYTVTVETVRLESNLYDAGTTKLIWSAASDLYDPRSEDLKKVFNELANRFLRSLEEAGLVPRKKS